MTPGKKLSLALGFAAMVMAAAPAVAQPASMRASIPFSFVAGNEVLPSGDYVVTFDHFNHILLEQRRGTGMQVVQLGYRQPMRPATNLGSGMLQFYRYGDTLVLGNVWRPGQAEGAEIKLTGRGLEARQRGEAVLVTLE
jgi:hypothetical protein